MKFIPYFSLFLISLSYIEAKSEEVLFNRTTDETVVLSNPHCKRLIIENLGDKPVKNCFPYAKHPPCFTLEDLAARISDSEYPLMALYQMWKQSVVIDEGAKNHECHPLDLLNFKGTCTSEDFSIQFLKLCNALGIETRHANIHGKERYDFCIDEDWHFLDLFNQQIYLNLNNEKLASSEEVMDDPFIALRTKHLRQSKNVDFHEGWKELARFEILEPASALPIVFETAEIKDRPVGLDLYPREKLFFTQVGDHEFVVEHAINLNVRKVSKGITLKSPLPICKLKNDSHAPILLVDQNARLSPGQTYDMAQPSFEVKVAFSQTPKGQLLVSSCCTSNLMPAFSPGENQLTLGSTKNPSQVLVQYELDESTVSAPLQIVNESSHFEYCSPIFKMNGTQQFDKVWWQIALDPQFNVIPANLDQIEASSSAISLPLISETFLNPETTYYFRAKGASQGKWSDWSSPFAFTVKKPLAVEAVQFNEIADNRYELNWERFAEETNGSTEYLIFGSNSLDFIPSVYCDKQVNAIVNGVVVEEESNDNLIAVTNVPRFEVNGELAYYRIIAKQRGQLSVPSYLIHVYDEDLIQPRNVLQSSQDEAGQEVAKRSLFPPAYPGSENALPHLNSTAKESILSSFQTLLRSASLSNSKYRYESPEVDDAVWEEVKPYLLPANHPAWPKLNRVFCKNRATLSPDEFKKSGFKRWRPGKWSRVSASSHPELKEYFIKAYCDVETGIIYDWKKWIHRIEGAETIRDCIKKYHLQEHFAVPHKWIYPLPKNPAPPNSSRIVRKNFILVCENMRIEEHSKNEKYYKKKMTPRLMQGLYIILQVCGLYDSVYCFNIPFCKDGRIAVIDTEYHHKWPVPFYKLKKSFSKDMGRYWERLTFKGGKIPDGVSQHNPPRMDRRDVHDGKHK